ncbi:MAG: rRNA maturation RNase YbeY [bacterium]
MAIQIETIHPSIDVDCEALKRIGEKALKEQGRSSWMVSLTLVDDPYIQRLNKDYLNRDHPTDVLAFPIDELDGSDERGEKILGDIYISLDRAQDQSEEYQVPFGEEVARLMLHGLFHLLGYNHEEMSPMVEEYLKVRG